MCIMVTVEVSSNQAVKIWLEVTVGRNTKLTAENETTSSSVCYFHWLVY